MVMMWSAPDTDSMLATSLAEMGARLCKETNLLSHMQLVYKHNSAPPKVKREVSRTKVVNRIYWADTL